MADRLRPKTAYARFLAMYGTRIKRAWLSPTGTVHVQTSQPDLVTNKTRSAMAVIQPGGGQAAPPQELGASVVAHAPSPSSWDKWAYLISESGNTGSVETGGSSASSNTSKVLKVEVWEKTKGITHSVRVDDVHGAFVTGEQLGGLMWNSREDALVYVAEKKTSPLDTHELCEDWGEQLTGVRCPVCVLFSLVSSRAVALTGTGSVQRSAGQPHFFSDPSSTNRDDYLIHTSYVHGSYRLGLIYCQQRPSELRCVNVATILSTLHNVTDDTTTTTLNEAVAASFSRVIGPAVTEDMKSGSARCARVSPDGSTLVFLYTPFSETHNGPATLMSSRDGGYTCHTLVDLVHNARQDEFPGLYTTDLPTPAFTSDSRYVLLNSNWGFKSCVVKVHVESGELTVYPSMYRLAGATTASSGTETMPHPKRTKTNASPHSQHSMCVYCVADSSLALVLVSSFTLPGDLCWLNLLDGSVSAPIFSLAPRLVDLTTQLIPHHSTTAAVDSTTDTYYESMLIKPTHFSSGAMVVNAHGGPHAQFTDTFIMELAFFVRTSGCALLCVNYRGSTGLSLASLNSLPGNVGKQDVNDVHDAHLHVLASQHGDSINPAKIGVMGGSHGGFITSHLIGQYPHTYHAAAMRNPVTDIATMCTVTDIGDWCFVEVLGRGMVPPTKYTRPPSVNELTAMRSQSPIAHVDKVVTPSLIMLGMQDRRVAPSQGLEFAKAIKVLGKAEVHVLRFADDNHALDKPQTSEIVWEKFVDWFKTKLVG